MLAPEVQKLADALGQDEFVFYYQPKVSLINGRTSGAEALMRWNHPDGRMRLPKHFIPQAERSGYITEMGLAMFPRLLTDMQLINDLHPTLVTSFNLSAQDLLDSRMTNLICMALEHKVIEPKQLELELTEASLLEHDNPIVRANLERLTNCGVTLAMDDYGTGYSTIDTLSQWPFSRVKLDKGLIQRMVGSEKSATIVQASIRMAHQLGIEIVAEGIETAACYDFLLHAGCTHAQGFWLGRPMPLSDYLEFLTVDRRWSGLPIGLIHMATLDHIHWRQALVTEATLLAFGGHENCGEIHVCQAELDHTRCKLGHWYYGHGREFAGNPHYDRLEEPHQRLHEMGAEILAAARSGIDRVHLTERLRELTQQSTRVLELLQELESEAMISQIMPPQLESL